MYGTYIQSSIIHTIDNQPTIHNHPQSTQFHPSTTQIIPNTTNTTLNFHNITPSILSLYTPLHIYPVPFIPILQQYKTYTLHTLLPPLHTIPPSVLPPTILDHTFLPPLLPPLTTTNHQTHTRYPTTIAHCLPDCRPVTGGQQLGLSASFKTFRIQKLRLLLLATTPTTALCAWTVHRLFASIHSPHSTHLDSLHHQPPKKLIPNLSATNDKQ